MRRRRAMLLLGFIVIVGVWWITSCGSAPQPTEGVLDVWVTWGESPEQLQALFDRYGQASGLPVEVATGLDNDLIEKAMAGATPPDLVILSSNDLVRSYFDQGLLEPLDAWIEVAGIDLDDIYPAPLAQCQVPDAATMCLPWGSDTYALFWNKDLFEAAGLEPERPPRTMEELVEYAGKLTLRDGEGELAQIGFVPDLTRSHTELYARMFGGSWTDDEGTELSANSQAMIDAAYWQRGFYDNHGAEGTKDFVLSLNRYLNSRHPVYAGKRLSCQQCHVSAPRKKSPAQGFYEGKVAMLVDGQWQLGTNSLSSVQPGLNYGVAPFPPPAGHPERANSTVVQGPVVIIPAAVKDKAAAASLLAWMMSPEILAEEMHAISKLPTSRAAAQDPRFRQMPGFGLFVDLLSHPNAGHNITTPISAELNEALGQAEEEMLHSGSDPVSLLEGVQAEFASKLQEALAYHNRP